MQKRTFDKLNLESSLLGFGCMRFPQQNGKIDFAKTEQMIDYAYARGVTYYDTAYVYQNGESETTMAAALRKYPRGSYTIADKLPVWMVQEPADCGRLFSTQLERLGTDYIDFYLLHSMDADNWAQVVKYDMIDFGRRLKAEGKIRFLGFSFHDAPPLFQEILDAADWDFVQIQLNYVDWDNQRARELYAMAESRGVPIVVMEPVRGGDLANPLEEVRTLFEAQNPGATPASWALRYAASLPQVKVVLSGMSDFAQVKDNIATFSPFRPLDENERAVLAQALQAYARLPKIGCTGCRYCMPCPFGVNIPENFSVYNDYQKFGGTQGLQFHWNVALGKGKADACKACGVCVSKCPQHLAIPDELKKVNALAPAFTRA